MNDATFLGAISARPEDGQLRLTYADWLEEQRDPRAELIRIEASTRGLPAWDDRCWNSRARRYELQAALPQEWLEQLGYARCYRPLFDRPLPAEREYRWRLMHTFLETWHGVDWSERRDVQPAEIAAAEHRLGMPLPPAMREFYEQAGSRLSFWSKEDRTSSIGSLCVPSGPTTFPGIQFRTNYESSAHWYVPSDTGQADPPVRSIEPGTGRPEKEDCATFSEFALFTLILETVRHGATVRSHFFSPFEDLLSLIGPHTGLSRCEFACDYWKEGEVHLIEGVDTWLAHHRYHGFLYETARTEAARQAFGANLDVWLTGIW